jgi:hypothetical protein
VVVVPWVVVLAPGVVVVVVVVAELIVLLVGDGVSSAKSTESFAGDDAMIRVRLCVASFGALAFGVPTVAGIWPV